MNQINIMLPFVKNLYIISNSSRVGRCLNNFLGAVGTGLTGTTFFDTAGFGATFGGSFLGFSTDEGGVLGRVYLKINQKIYF